VWAGPGVKKASAAFSLGNSHRQSPKGVFKASLINSAMSYRPKINQENALTYSAWNGGWIKTAGGIIIGHSVLVARRCIVHSDLHNTHGTVSVT